MPIVWTGDKELSKQIIIKVDSCFDCPYCQSVYEHGAHIPVCAYKGLNPCSPAIFDPMEIDPNCPLPEWDKDLEQKAENWDCYRNEDEEEVIG